MNRIFILVSAFFLATAASASESDLWAAIKLGGHAVLMRHALAPGTGDPSNFEVGDCTTQRNLSEIGRQQARNIGQAFRNNGIDAIDIYSSQWCRCLQTARLLNIGEVTAYPGLNSFFNDRSQRDEKTLSAKNLIVRSIANPVNPSTSIVLVTHQVNITALTDIYPRSGEMIVVKPVGDILEVVGRIDSKIE